MEFLQSYEYILFQMSGSNFFMSSHLNIHLNMRNEKCYVYNIFTTNGQKKVISVVSAN